MEEQWVCVCDGFYTVSSLGRVRREKQGVKPTTKVGRILRQTTGSHGYLGVAISTDGKPRTRLVHHLVAEAFLCERRLGQEIHHLNGNKTDNRASNLAYVTHKENQEDMVKRGKSPRGGRNGMSKLNDGQVREIKRLVIAGTSQRQVSRRFGVCAQTICNVINGATWRHV